jgi:hypothetical protein
MSAGPAKLVVPMFLLGLLSGAALGSWGQRALFHRHQRAEAPNAERALDHLDRELHLDAQQKETVKKILLAKQTESAALEKERRDKAAALRQSARREISGALHADQLAAFQSMCDRADKRIKERWPEDKQP